MAPEAKVTAATLRARKGTGERIAIVTAYDVVFAGLADRAGVDAILVGDSLGMVMQGERSTLGVTLDEMVYHCRIAARGVTRAHLIGDLPFMSYQASVEDGMRAAGRLMKEGHAEAVKLEGGESVAELCRRLVQAGIPVMGHIGLTPQAIHQLSGYKVQGRTPEAAERLLEDAVALQQAGAFAVVLETIPAPLAELISRRLRIPTIGIGAGAGCDGQVQVWHDLLTYQTTFISQHMPRHVKQYANVSEVMRAAIEQYASEVRSGAFPTKAESFQMPREVLAELSKTPSS